MSTETAATATVAGEEVGFDALLADLNSLQKAMADDTDENVAGAAGEAAEEEADAGEGNQDDGDADPDGEGSDTFGKSFEVTLPDGTKVPALDGTAMMKALHEENAALRGQATQQGDLIKSLGELVKGMRAEQVESGKLLKSIRGDLARLAGTGAGRKAVVTVSPKGATAAAAPAAIGPDEIMAKAQSLMGEGKLVGTDVNRIHAYLSRGLGVPSDYAPLFTA